MSAERGRVALAALRPPVSSRLDLARASGGHLPQASKSDEPSRFPCQRGAIYVGRAGHAADLGLLKQLCIGAVLNCAPNVCVDPVSKYQKVSFPAQLLQPADSVLRRLESRTWQYMPAMMLLFEFWTSAWSPPRSLSRPRIHAELQF